MRCAHVALIVLATILSVAWYNLVMIRFLRGIPWNVPVSCPNTHEKVHVYTERVQSTRGIFHDIPRESVT